MVFTETDAKPVDEHWLKEMVASLPDEKTIVKGLEAREISWDLSNLAIHRNVFLNQRFDESFGRAADSEFLSRLKVQGYRLAPLSTAPIVHLKKAASRRYIRRAFQYGLYWARLRYRYSDPVELITLVQVGNVLKASLLNLIGLLIGWVIYLPERHLRKKAE